MADYRYWEAERERIITQVKKRLEELFPSKHLNWLTCPYHKTLMCEVSKKGENTYWECFEFDDENKMCGHKEFGI